MHEMMVVIPGGEDFEYFCKDCGQLRLFVDGNRKFNGCGNCGSEHVLKGKPGELDKDALVREFEGSQT